MKRLLALFFVLGALAACEGPMGPEGPAGPQGQRGLEGPQGPVGPAGSGANYWFGQGTADADGFYGVRFDDQVVSGIVAQCWTRETSGDAWIQVAVVDDPSAPSDLLACLQEQDGQDVIVGAFTYEFWEVLIVAVAIN